MRLCAIDRARRRSVGGDQEEVLDRGRLAERGEALGTHRKLSSALEAKERRHVGVPEMIRDLPAFEQDVERDHDPRRP